MKYTFFSLLTLTIIPASIVCAQSSDGYIISQEKFYNVPMPDWMKEANYQMSELKHSGTVTAKAYPTNGHVSPSVTNISGNISADLYNDTNNNEYYTFDQFVCAINNCNEYKSTISLRPGDSYHHNETLYLAVQFPKQGTYQNATSCLVTGAGNAKVINYAPIDIAK